MIWLLLACGMDKLPGGTGHVESRGTGMDAVAEFPVEVDSSVDAFMISATGESLVALHRLIAPDGTIVIDWQDWTGSEQALTSAIWGAKDTTLNWPIRESDGAPAEGEWTAEIMALDPDGTGLKWSDIEATIQTKKDRDWSSGKVRVTLAMSEDVIGEAGLSDAVDSAVERWKQIWTGFGLDLELTRTEIGLGGDLSLPEGQNNDLQNAGEAGDETDVLLIIGETIDGGTEYLGVAGSIPGPLVAAPRGAVLVSWLANAGSDGVFDSEDIRLFGETMAHEVSHYLGLFHPVEIDMDSWDALQDTENCESTLSCESIFEKNLMFPYPVCDFNSCVPQGELSNGQQASIHRNVGVR